MKRLLSVLLALCITSPAFAQSPLSTCDAVPELAGLVMARRQVNADIMLMLNYLTEEYADRTELLGWAQAMIDMAYTQAVAPEAAARSAQIEAFKALWLERCLAKMQ